MKFRVKNTTLKHNDRLYPEGSLIELSPEEAKELMRILETAEEPAAAEPPRETVEEKPKKGGKK